MTYNNQNLIDIRQIRADQLSGFCGEIIRLSGVNYLSTIPYVNTTGAQTISGAKTFSYSSLQPTVSGFNISVDGDPVFQVSYDGFLSMYYLGGSPLFSSEDARFYHSNGNSAIAFADSYLGKSNGDVALDWENEVLNYGNVTSINWGQRWLGVTGAQALNWSGRYLLNNTGQAALNWGSPSGIEMTCKSGAFVPTAASMYAVNVNESTSQLIFRVKYSNGSTVKTGILSLA